MKTYVFTYFTPSFESCQFRVNSSRFSQAYASFCTHICVISQNRIVGSFSPSYEVVSNDKISCRYLSYNHILALEAIKDKCDEN